MPRNVDPPKWFTYLFFGSLALALAVTLGKMALEIIADSNR